MEPVVDAAWLSDHPDAIVADVRWYLDGRSGRAAYEGGHLPGAIFVDIGSDLARHGEPTEGRHPLPSPEYFAAAIGRLGIGDGDTVVAYDDTGGSTAARLVWMLRVTGHDAALLDGGLAAYTGELETGSGVPRPPTTFAVTPWPADRIVSADDIAAGAASTVIDARAGERYRGEVEPVDPRAGHIPGALNAPWADNLLPDSRFADPDTLRARYRSLGVTADDPVVYCGSGITACHDVLALERAGYPNVKLFVGSWSAWSSDPARPVATGDE
ncbi:MAG: sulfurtransferase [Acidimicrobiia bacterium]